jgi:molecular chaperone IbpA
MTKTLSLRSLDIPQVNKFGIGFDNIFDELMRVTSQQLNTNYPPHNVIKTGEQSVTIEIAVAGFDEGDIDITLEKNIMTVAGSKKNQSTDNVEYLYRGLSSRDFKQTFQLSEFVEIESAMIKNGILSIFLERKIPENQKPKSIAITYVK